MFPPHPIGHQACRGPSRRELLKFGGLSLFGLGLPELLACRACAGRRFGRCACRQVEALHRVVHAGRPSAPRNLGPEARCTRRSPRRLGLDRLVRAGNPGRRVDAADRSPNGKNLHLASMLHPRQRAFDERLCDVDRRAPYSAGRRIRKARGAERLSIHRSNRQARRRPARRTAGGDHADRSVGERRQ